MKPDPRFLRQPPPFWAHVRAITEEVGYTAKRKKGNPAQVKAATLTEVRLALLALGLSDKHIVDSNGRPTEFATLLLEYFKHRADELNTYVEPRLMHLTQAKAEFDKFRALFPAERQFTMNKQSGEKKVEAYFTGIVSMLIEINLKGLPCNYNPQQLTSISKGGVPLRTLARRVDGAFPSVVNPIAIWEIKEYYFTSTFGSRVAGGVYETLLDGMELEELRITEDIHVRHYLMIDGHPTWWDKGRSFLCRMVDMLHMGYADEVLFGYEVIERLPSIVAEWVQIARSRP